MLQGETLDKHYHLIESQDIDSNSCKASQEWRKALTAVLCFSFNEEIQSSSDKKKNYPQWNIHAAAIVAYKLAVPWL